MVRKKPKQKDRFTPPSSPDPRDLMDKSSVAKPSPEKVWDFTKAIEALYKISQLEPDLSPRITPGHPAQPDLTKLPTPPQTEDISENDTYSPCEESPPDSELKPSLVFARVSAPAYTSDGATYYPSKHTKRVDWDITANKWARSEWQESKCGDGQAHEPLEQTCSDGEIYDAWLKTIWQTGPSGQGKKKKAMTKKQKQKSKARQRAIRAAARAAVSDPASETDMHKLKKRSPASRASVHNTSVVIADDQVNAAAAITEEEGVESPYYGPKPTPKSIQNQHQPLDPVSDQPATVKNLQQSLQQAHGATPSRMPRHVAAGLTPNKHIGQPAFVPRQQSHVPFMMTAKADRDFHLRLRLIHHFAEDKAWLAKPVQLANHTNNPTGIHVFVDFSNIQIGFWQKMEGLFDQYNLEPMQHPALSFGSLVLVLERARPVAKRVLAGSEPLLPAIALAESIGYECNVLAKVFKVSTKEPWRGQKYLEQGVDEILQLKMSCSILDTDISGLQPSTIVLATGDGAAAEYGDGFLRMAERALHKGWCVELVAWEGTIGHGYRVLEEQWPGWFRIIVLDAYAEHLLDGP